MHSDTGNLGFVSHHSLGHSGTCTSCCTRPSSASALLFSGLPTDLAFYPHLCASGCGEAHHPGRTEPATATVGSARVRVPFPHPRQPSPCHCTALQQLKPSMPELLGERMAVGWARWGASCFGVGSLGFLANTESLDGWSVAEWDGSGDAPPGSAVKWPGKAPVACVCVL